MEIRQWVVNSFTQESFGGNPAAVCLLDREIDDAAMLSIARQNRYSETAFVLESGSGPLLRWFTPAKEVDLCGHATLATAWVLFHELGRLGEIVFQTREAGPLKVVREDRAIWMDFPARPPRQIECSDRIRQLTGLDPLEAWLARDLLLVLEHPDQVRDFVPDFAGLRELAEFFAVVPTAADGDAGFVSRYFAPNAGIDEDPVTGSSHCTLIPFWADRLGKTDLASRQLSSSGGRLSCKAQGDRVGIGGECVLYSRGVVFIP